MLRLLMKTWTNSLLRINSVHEIFGNFKIYQSCFDI